MFIVSTFKTSSLITNNCINKENGWRPLLEISTVPKINDLGLKQGYYV